MSDAARGDAEPSEIGEIFLTEGDLQQRVAELGKEISLHYGTTPVTAVGILKGSLFFLSDLVRQVAAPVRWEFLQMESYRDGTRPDGPPQLRLDTISARSSLAGEHLLVVEDILDTGATLTAVRERLLAHRPASLKTAVLLDKPSRRRVPIEADWVGFEVPDRFLVGYGLDYQERYRNLPYLAILRQPADPS